MNSVFIFYWQKEMDDVSLTLILWQSLSLLLSSTYSKEILDYLWFIPRYIRHLCCWLKYLNFDIYFSCCLACAQECVLGGNHGPLMTADVGLFYAVVSFLEDEHSFSSSTTNLKSLPSPISEFNKLSRTFSIGHLSKQVKIVSCKFCEPRWGWSLS